MYTLPGNEMDKMQNSMSRNQGWESFFFFPRHVGSAYLYRHVETLHNFILHASIQFQWFMKLTYRRRFCRLLSYFLAFDFWTQVSWVKIKMIASLALLGFQLLKNNFIKSSYWYYPSIRFLLLKFPDFYIHCIGFFNTQYRGRRLCLTMCCVVE